jgi:phosphatidylserine decarboxylase
MTDPGAPDNRSSVLSPARDEVNARIHSDPDALPLSGLGRLLLAILYLLPKNGISRIAGWIASLHLPGPLQRLEIQLFARLAGVDLSEAKEPIEFHRSLQHFFTRALRDDARSIEGDSLSLVAPCDGAWGEAGRIEQGTLLQVKGRRYAVTEFLGDRDLASRYDGGSFATFYLSPRDYHRFHTPLAGCFRRIDYIPGSLWPVNAIGLRGVDRLFARNERICAYLDVGGDSVDGGRGAEWTEIVLVAVGATMVGSIHLSFDDLTSNTVGRRPARRDLGDRMPRFERGEQWGHFEFGSTIVMLTPPGLCALEPRPVGEALRLGQVIGRRCD